MAEQVEGDGGMAGRRRADDRRIEAALGEHGAMRGEGRSPEGGRGRRGGRFVAVGHRGELDVRAGGNGGEVGGRDAPGADQAEAETPGSNHAASVSSAAWIARAMWSTCAGRKPSIHGRTSAAASMANAPGKRAGA